MKTLGMMLEFAMNEARKDWKLPDAASVYAATANNIKLGLRTAIMDASLQILWNKYYHIKPNDYNILAPSFKRGTYEKGDKIIRDNSTKIETKGDYEVWNYQTKYQQMYAFYNTKTKIWYMNAAGYLSYNG